MALDITQTTLDKAALVLIIGEDGLYEFSATKDDEQVGRALAQIAAGLLGDNIDRDAVVRAVAYRMQLGWQPDHVAVAHATVQVIESGEWREQPMSAEDVVSGEAELRRIVESWRLQVNAGPGTRPTMAELGDPVDERERAEMADYIASWDQDWQNDRHRRLVARVEFTEGLLRLWDALNEAGSDG